jgi:hypothetical protein
MFNMSFLLQDDAAARRAAARAAKSEQAEQVSVTTNVRIVGSPINASIHADRRVAAQPVHAAFRRLGHPRPRGVPGASFGIRCRHEESG